MVLAFLYILYNGTDVFKITLHIDIIYQKQINRQQQTDRVQDYLDSEARYRNDVIVSLRFG